MPVIKFIIPPDYNASAKGTYFDAGIIRELLMEKFPDIVSNSAKKNKLVDITHYDSNGEITIIFDRITLSQEDGIKNEISRMVEFRGFID